MYTTHVEKVAPKTTLSVTINCQSACAIFTTCVVYTKYVYTQWNVSILVLLQVAVIIIIMIIWRCHYLSFHWL